MSDNPLSDRAHLQGRALFLAERIDLRALEQARRLADMPLTVQAGERGVAVLFRYGAVVLFELSSIEEASFLNLLQPFASQRFPEPESEEVEIVIRPKEQQRIDGAGVIHLQAPSVERLQVVADMLAKTVVLAHYESRIAEVFDRIEPLAEGLKHKGRSGSQGKKLLQEIGNVLLTQQKMVGRAEIADKPELLWEHPELERLYARLQSEFELNERHRALDLKLVLISRTVGTVLELMQNTRSLRVEWYIVILILVEIVFTIYELLSPTEQLLHSNATPPNHAETSGPQESVA